MIFQFQGSKGNPNKLLSLPVRTVCFLYYDSIFLTIPKTFHCRHGLKERTFNTTTVDSKIYFTGKDSLTLDKEK